MTDTQEAPQRHDEPIPSTGDPRLDAHKGWLVQEGNEIGKKARDNQDWKSQIRGILEAARTETHPKVLENLVQYQAARNKNWREERDVMTPLVNAMDRCQKAAGDDLALAMELIRHLLLYTLRAHTYADRFLSRRAQQRNGGTP